MERYSDVVKMDGGLDLVGVKDFDVVRMNVDSNQGLGFISR